MEREEVDKQRDKYIKELTSARESLSWENFDSVPIEKKTELRKKYNEFISIIQSYVCFDFYIL